MPIQLTETTSNVHNIKEKIKDEINEIEDMVLLDSQFLEIFDCNSSRGINYWKQKKVNSLNNVTNLIL